MESANKAQVTAKVRGGLKLELGLDRRQLVALGWLSVFAAAMAYVESAVVAYLRLLYFPSGFVIESAQAVSEMDPAALTIEIGREVATVVMLAAVSLLTARSGWWERLAFFLWSFAVWDIFYYVWLYVFLRWPADLLTLDLLFLVPRPWVAPVLLPVTVSGIMMASAAAILRRS